MAFGIDTASSLANVNWSAFYTWKSAYPVFAGRYFSGCNVWQSGEADSVKSDTDNTLQYVTALQGCNQSRLSVAGSTGFSYGAADGLDTVAAIASAVNGGDLGLPAGGETYVFLDIEPSTTLSVDYWAGWANAVGTYTFQGFDPFSPAIYCKFVLGSDGKYSPVSTVQTALNNAYGAYPNSVTECAAFWSSEPEPCSYCSPSAAPSWNFDLYYQPTSDGTIPVPVVLYQYAERPGCVNTCSNPPAVWAGGQNLDMDDSGTTSPNATAFMLTTP